MLLYGIVEGSFILNIACVHVGSFADQVQAQRHRLHRVDQARAPVEIGLFDVGSVLNETLHNLQVRHKAGATYGRRTSVRRRIQRRAQSD